MSKYLNIALSYIIKFVNLALNFCNFLYSKRAILSFDILDNFIVYTSPSLLISNSNSIFLFFFSLSLGFHGKWLEFFSSVRFFNFQDICHEMGPTNTQGSPSEKKQQKENIYLSAIFSGPIKTVSSRTWPPPPISSKLQRDSFPKPYVYIFIKEITVYVPIFHSLY